MGRGAVTMGLRICVLAVATGLLGSACLPDSSPPTTPDSPPIPSPAPTATTGSGYCFDVLTVGRIVLELRSFALPDSSTITACREGECLEFDVETSQFSPDGLFVFYDFAKTRSFVVDLRLMTNALQVGFQIAPPYFEDGEVFSVKIRHPAGPNGRIVIERSTLAQYKVDIDRACGEKLVAHGHVVLD